MATMFETIMELPLFKGIGADLLSQMLEKTSIEFLKFRESEKISHAHQRVKALDFILSGEVKRIYEIPNYGISLEEIMGPGTVIGALHLFGMVNTYRADTLAHSDVSIMRLEKSQYMNILQSDKIYILNFVNFLSAAAQKSQFFLQETDTQGITRTLNMLDVTLAHRMATKVKLAGTDLNISRFCGVTLQEFQKWKLQAQEKGELITESDGLILRCQLKGKDI